MKDKRITYFIIYAILIIAIVIVAYFCFVYKNENNINEVADPYEYRSAIFVANGVEIEKNKINCIVNGNKCEITMPNIINDDGYVLGWSDVNGKEAKYKVGQIINIDKNMVFYAITYRVLSLSYSDSNLYFMNEDNISCKVYNNDTSCNVTIPNFNAKGYENRGFSTVKDAITGIYYPGATITLTKNTTIYPIYNTLTRQRTIDVLETLYGYNSIIEIERGCNDNARRSYLSYIETITKKAKYLLIGSKISFLSTKTFDEIWGSNYAGMNYGPSAFRMFDIKCSEYSTNSYYGTMVHELAHTWDFNYSNYYDHNISDEAELVNIFNKYKNMSNRPFRDYSYSNIREFLADAYKYYYFKYIDMDNQYVSLDYPEDIRQTMEKYICITKNDFNKNACQ